MSKSPQMSPRAPVGPLSDKKCCGVITESVHEAQERRRRPQPWVIRKLWILVTFGIMGYSGYAFISKLCLPMVEREWRVLGGRATGIVLLVFFSILYLWIIWAYITVILTPPGYARDHIGRTERPPLSDCSPSAYYGPSGASTSEAAHSDTIAGQMPSLSEKTHGSTQQQDGDSIAGPSYEHMLQNDSKSLHPSQAKEPNAGVLDTIGQPPLSTDTQPNILGAPLEAGASQRNREIISPAPPSRRDARRVRKLTKETVRNRRLEALNIFRKPSSTPVLQPAFRYCETDELVKPYRAHHCSACGTCVLRYDHHCPWIGQCVGARNHKFFLNFCFATSIFTAYIFASVLFFIIKSTRISEGYDLDPHFIVLLALAALFWLFTTGLSVSHVRLITRGQTTVESMQFKAVKEREEQTLARGFGWWECRAKRKRKRSFDEEWGSTNTEGNIWWRGNAYEEWMDVMGKRWLGWIFPIGRGLSDGLWYPVNPRFDSDGRMRKRAEWPEELR